jgi:hypothetical protein
VLPPLRLEVFGLTFGLNFKYDYRAKASLRPAIVPKLHEKVELLKIGNPIQNQLNCGDFEINRRYQLGMQLYDIGKHDGAIIGGMLNCAQPGCVPEELQWHTTIVSQLFANLLENCYVANLVTNDDSSVHKILKNYY